MKSVRRLFAVTLLLSIVQAVFAANDPNVARGFSPGQVYDVGEIDSINPFNGNLILQIPIGPVVQVRPGFSYQLLLSYNSTVWDYEFRNHENYPNDPEPMYKRFAVPETQSNAGLGWIVSLGQLFKPVPGTPTTAGHGWLYVEPNGSSHEFSEGRWGMPSEGAELYTSDGTYLRLMHGPADAWHEIEFPDGTIRRFNADGLLTEIRDRFGNRVSIDVTPDLWTITDSASPGREQKIHFTALPGLENTHFHRVVSLVELTGPEGRTLRYNFDYLDGDPAVTGYQPNVIDRGGYGDPVMSELDAKAAVLDHVTLPDGSQFRMQTHVENFPGTAFGNPHNGSIHHLELPSGATLDWTYGQYELSVTECNPDDFWTSIQSGVERRTVTVDGQASVWTYTRTFTRKPMPAGQTIGTGCPSGQRILYLPFFPPDEFQSTVRDPHGIETTHYYAIYPEGGLPANSQFNNSSDYGQPFSRRKLNPTEHSLPIQSEVLDCSAAPCPAVGTPEREPFVLRRTYVEFEDDGWTGEVRWNSRRKLERVEYLRESLADTEMRNCGGKVCYVETRSEDFDGYGNFRETIVETNFPGQPSRVTRTNFNPGSDRFGKSGGSMFFGIDDPWLLGRFTDISVSAVSGGTPETKSDYCFDAQNGFLHRQRVRRAAAGTKRDIVTTYADSNGDGSVDEESTWGGDPLPGESLDPLDDATWTCDGSQSFGPVRSRVQHTYSKGARATSRIAGSPFLSLDQTIDVSGAISSARDPQGLATTLKYDDVLGRLTEVHPPGGLPWTHYGYMQRSGSTPASLVTRTFPSTATGSGGTPLTHGRAYYDGLGRLIQTKSLMPDGSWSATGTIYDATGRAKSTSAPQTATQPDFTPSFDPPQKTRFEYDALGRVVKTTAPDGTITTRDYDIKTPPPSEAGDPTRVTTTTVMLATGANGAMQPVPTVEKYDGFGRLCSVTESIDANGVKTRYAYDLSDRLRTVTAGAQIRSFVYDGAGLLTSDSHPENGTSTYTWDVAGRVTTRRVGTEEVRSVYDFAGRVKSVRDQTRALDLQAFDYDTAIGPNGESMAANGRLLKQVRHNVFAGVGTFSVADYFMYDNAGRLSQKETVVTDPAGASSRFTLPFEYHPDSSLPSKQKYLTCTGCTGAVLPQRSPDLAWSAGMLQSVGGFADGITYRPHGGVAEVWHSNGVTDFYDADPNGMARPQAIRVTSARQCDLIETPPASETTTPGGTVVLHVTAKDPTASITWYRGFRGDTDAPVGTGSSLTLTNVTSSQFYWVRLESIQGGCVSDSSTVTVAPCAPPEILTPAASSILYVVAPNATVSAEVTAVATNISYVWKILPADTEIAACRNSRTCSWTPAVLNQQQELQVTVSGSCGPSVTRVIKRFMLVDGSCVASVAASFPPEIPKLDDGSIELSVLMDARHDPYVFHWFLDDSLVSTEDERSADPSSFGTSSLNITVGSGATLSVQITRYCAPGGGAIQSPTVIRKTYVWDGDDCPAPKVKLNQTAVILGSPDVTRTFIAQSDWGSLTYQWYRGDSGNTREPLPSDPGAPDKFTAPNAPGTYWVRANSPCGTQWDSATLVVSSASCELPVRFTQQPQSAIVHAGTQTTLQYDATAKPLPNSTRWYEGPGTAALVGSAPSLSVVPLRTTTYWAEVSNGCHTANSAYATLSVRSCSNINYTLAGREYEIRGGQSQLLSVTATANNNRALFYKWYEGRSGDTAHPVQLGEVPQVSVSPAKTTQYWARIHFNDPALCAVDTDEVTVYVCNVPALKQPMANMLSTVPYVPHWIVADSEGERLHYQWYIGAKGVKTIPLAPGLRMMRVAPAETTSYWVEISNDCRIGNDEVFQSDAITISVCPQNIAVTAANAEVMSGATTTLGVTASGGNLKYKWYRGQSGDTNNPINPGLDPTDAATITTPPITAGTSFWVRVYSGDCFRNSDTITVGLCSLPTIGWTSGLTQVHANESQILQLTAAPANAVITYYKGPAGNISGSEVIAGPTVNRGVSITTAATTTYWARATLEGTVCSANAPAFTVTVCLPTITAQPQPQFFNSTTAPSVTLSVTATAAQSYQWYIGDSGVTGNPVNGGTNASLSVSPTSETKYWVRVTGACGSPVDSTAALVSVCQQPAITTTPASRVAASGSQVLLDLVATGSSLTYQWYRGLSGDTTTPIAGALSASYTATQTATTNYWVRVTGACGAVNSSTIKISIAPVITTQPATVYINSGATASFSVVATGNELTYRWYSGSTQVGSAQAFVTPALTSTTSYFVRVLSGDASVDSATVEAFVCQPKQITVGQPASVSGSQVTLSVTGPDAAETYEWYVWTTPTTSQLIGGGTATLVYPDQTTDYTLRTKRSTCYADRRITVTVCQPRITAHPAGLMINPGQSTTLTVTAVGTPTLTYQWYSGTSGNTSSPLTTGPSLTVTPSNDSNYWVKVTSGAGSGCSVNSNTALVQVCKPPVISVHPGSANVGVNTPVTLSVNATGTDLTYQWYRGAAGVTTNPVGTNAATYSFTATATDDYWVRITGRCGTISSTAAKVSVPPVITSPPTARYITSGTTTTFNVTASGAQLSYQWYQGSTVVGSGTSYTTPALTASTAYWVRVWSGNQYTDSSLAWAFVCTGRSISVSQTSQASNSRVDLTVVSPAGDETYDWYAGVAGDPSRRVGGGAAVMVYPLETTTYYLRTSKSTCYADSSVTVSVLYPTFTTQPQNFRINPGGSATMTAAATGTPPLTYQWYSDGVAISGATSGSLTVSPPSTKYYYVQARSGSYSTNSGVVYVSVCVPPAITSQPPSTIIYNTDTVTLFVGTTGDGLTYQWYQGASGNTATPAGSGNPLVITPGTTKSYWVRVTGECGSVNSAAALQSVRPTITSQPADAQVCAGANATVSINTSTVADSYTWYRVDGGTNTYIGSGTSIAVSVPSAITVWCDVASGNAHTYSRMVSLTTRPGPTASVSKWWIWDTMYRLQANVAEEDLPYAVYTWYRGPIGNVAASQYYSEGYAVTVYSSGTTETYWVRVTNTQTGCSTDRGVNVPY